MQHRSCCRIVPTKSLRFKYRKTKTNAKNNNNKEWLHRHRRVAFVAEALKRLLSPISPASSKLTVCSFLFLLFLSLFFLFILFVFLLVLSAHLLDNDFKLSIQADKMLIMQEFLEGAAAALARAQLADEDGENLRKIKPTSELALQINDLLYKINKLKVSLCVYFYLRTSIFIYKINST